MLSFFWFKRGIQYASWLPHNRFNPVKNIYNEIPGRRSNQPVVRSEVTHWRKTFCPTSYFSINNDVLLPRQSRYWVRSIQLRGWLQVRTIQNLLISDVQFVYNYIPLDGVFSILLVLWSNQRRSFPSNPIYCSAYPLHHNCHHITIQWKLCKTRALIIKQSILPMKAESPLKSVIMVTLLAITVLPINPLAPTELYKKLQAWLSIGIVCTCRGLIIFPLILYIPTCERLIIRMRFHLFTEVIVGFCMTTTA